MAGFFTLGSGSGRGSGSGSGSAHHQQNKDDHEEQQEREHTNNTLLFRNEEIYNKGFEIWPQSSSYHQHQNLTSYYSFGVGPSRRNNNNNNNPSSSNVNNNNNDDVSVSFSDESTRFGFTVVRPGGGGGGGFGGGGGGMNCQDCGNQAKKDCPHLRCRTCCKSRGFQCQTHVKSTWVPAAKRRERQQQLASLQNPQHSRQRHREGNQEAAAGSLAPVPITSTGLELGSFPPELNSPAVFRCVKVSAMDAQDERYGYQTAVNIGGHVFKGILYDQGQDNAPNYTSTAGGGEGSSGGGGAPPQNLITATTSTTGNPFDSSLYPAPLNAFMAGTQFFPPPRS